MATVNEIAERARYYTSMDDALDVLVNRYEAAEQLDYEDALDAAYSHICRAKEQRGEYVELSGIVVRASSQGYSIRLAPADLERVSAIYAEQRRPAGPMPVRSDWHYYR